MPKLVNRTNIAAYYVIPGNKNVFVRLCGIFSRAHKSYWMKQSVRLNGFFNLYIDSRTDPVESYGHPTQPNAARSVQGKRVEV